MYKVFVGLFCIVGVWATDVSASDRRFSYTYESAVLRAGEKEFEPWTTFRGGRRYYYSRFDQRLEFEMGLTDKLQTAVYFNSSASVVGPTRQETYKFSGLSSEWKLQLADPAADSFGFALYGEFTGAPDEIEWEAKLIFDKRFSDIVIAGNVVGEFEQEFAPSEVETEIVAEVNVGIAYLVTPSFSAGLEGRSITTAHAGEIENSVLFAGPALAWTPSSFWMVFSVLPQLPALKSSTSKTLDLVHYERLQARLLFGWHL